MNEPDRDRAGTEGPAVSVVVVNWNGREALARALPTIEASFEGVAGGCELIVVDNGSHDGSTAFLRAEHPACRLIENTDNTGFSPAANQGIRAARGRYVALLNNDVVVDRPWLAELVRAIERDDRIGAAGAQLRYLHDPGRINSAGIVVDLAGRARDRNDGLPAALEPKRDLEVFGVSAGAALYRRTMLDEVGLLDDRFFAYLEDVDLAWRAKRCGWRAVHVPTAIVLHAYSATSGQVRGLKRSLSARNHLWLLAKNASAAQLAIAVPITVVLAAWTAVLDVVRHEHAGIKGLRDGVRSLRAVRAERRGPYLPLRAFVVPRPFRYRFAARARRAEARATVEPEILALAQTIS